MTTHATTLSPDSCPSPQQQGSWRSYFSPSQWVVFGIFLLLGLILRWTLLDMRPYHHDESLHGMYGRYFYDWPNQNYYKYDPMLHGPMLYNCMRFIYAMFGDSLWAARTPVCIMGSLFMLVPFLFRGYFRPTATLILTCAVALSPTLIYWSRFLREDYWVVSGMLLTVYGCTRAPNGLKALLFFLGIAIQWCTKENIFVSAALVVAYLLFEDIFRLFFERRIGHLISVRLLPPLIGAISLGAVIKSPTTFGHSPAGWALGFVILYLVLELVAGIFVRYQTPLSPSQSTTPSTGDSALARLVLHVWEYPWHASLAFMLAAGVYCWFYGAGFRFADGIEWGLGQKGFEYWMKHHGMERIEGPFNFHIYVLGWYELPFLLAYALHLLLFYRRASLGIALAGLAVAVTGLIVAAQTDVSRLKEIELFKFHIWQFFKAKDRLDVLAVFILLGHAPLVTIQHLWRRQHALAATGYFFTATLFVYSYLGEKVPWLTIYPLVFGLPYLMLFFQDYAKRYGWAEFSNYSVRSLLGWGSLILVGSALLLWFEQKVWFSPNGWVETKSAWWLAAPCAIILVYLMLIARDYYALYRARVGSWERILNLVDEVGGLLTILLAVVIGGSFIAALLILFCRDEINSIGSLLFWFNEDKKEGMPTEMMMLALGLVCALFAVIDWIDPFLGRVNMGRLLGIVGALFLFRAAIQTNFLYAGKETEYLSQVHTTYDVAEIAQRIESEVQTERLNYRPKVLAAGEATWPLTWYFRHIPNEYAFSAKPEELKRFTYIFQDWKDPPEAGQIPDGYYVRRVNLRGWWVPDFRQMNLHRFLEVAINHYPWSPSGFQYVNLLTAKDTDRFKQ